MGFSNLNDHAGLIALDKWAQTRTYIDGYGPSQADVICFKAIRSPPSVDAYPNAHRWYDHIKSYRAEFPLLPGDAARLFSSYGPVMIVDEKDAGMTQKEGAFLDAHTDVAGINDNDDDDLFDSDSDEEEDQEMAAEGQRRLEEYRAIKAGKAKPVAKSIVILDIKPHGDDVDLNELKDHILHIEMDGLVWGSHKFVPVGYGIRKLQISVVVEDEKVSLDELEMKVVDDLPDYVQSMDVATMQKL